MNEPIPHPRPPGPGPVRVLVVNDSVDEVEQLCRLFEAAGAEVEIALGAIGAAQNLQRFAPDIVAITDLRAGGDDGCAVAQWFGRLGQGGARPLYVCVSNRAVSARRQRHLAAGFDLCLVQPVTATMVAGVVDLVAGGRFERRPHVPVPGALTAPATAAAPAAVVEETLLVLPLEPQDAAPDLWAGR